MKRIILASVALLMLNCSVCVAAQCSQSITTTESCDSIVQYGITWTLNNNYTVGQFVNGDYWVLDPGAGVTIVAIDPAYKTTPRAMNGAMINPGAFPQGYDGFGDYDAARNVAISMPIVLHGTQSLVSVKGNETAQNGGKQYIYSTAILTSVASSPPRGSFRPGITGTTKTIHNISSIDYSKLARFAIPTGITPNVATSASKIRRPFLLHASAEKLDYLHSSEVGNLHYYYYPQELTDAALMLNLDYENAVKEPLLISYLQLAIDIYSYFEIGLGVGPDGGENLGRKLPILIAGEVLGYAPMINLMARTGNYINLYGNAPYDGKPADYVSFPEDAKVFYVTENDVLATDGIMYDNNYGCPADSWCPDARNHTPAPYTEAMIGMPESAIRHSTYPQYSDASWAAMYRGIGTAEPCWVGDSMVVRMMGLVDRWNHQAWFDYVDRWVAIRSASPYRFTVPDQPSTPQYYAQTVLIKKVYDNYRHSFDARRLFRNVRVGEVEP